MKRRENRVASFSARAVWSMTVYSSWMPAWRSERAGWRLRATGSCTGAVGRSGERPGPEPLRTMAARGRGFNACLCADLAVLARDRLQLVVNVPWRRKNQRVGGPTQWHGGHSGGWGRHRRWLPRMIRRRPRAGTLAGRGRSSRVPRRCWGAGGGPWSGRARPDDAFSTCGCTLEIGERALTGEVGVEVVDVERRPPLHLFRAEGRLLLGLDVYQLR